MLDAGFPERVFALGVNTWSLSQQEGVIGAGYFPERGLGLGVEVNNEA